jgi:hypothetical protein
MNQGPRYVRLMEKSRGQKSRATVPLIYTEMRLWQPQKRDELTSHLPVARTIFVKSPNTFTTEEKTGAITL